MYIASCIAQNIFRLPCCWGHQTQQYYGGNESSDKLVLWVNPQRWKIFWNLWNKPLYKYIHKNHDAEMILDFLPHLFTVPYFFNFNILKHALHEERSCWPRAPCGSWGKEVRKRLMSPRDTPAVCQSLPPSKRKASQRKLNSCLTNQINHYVEEATAKMSL